MRYEEIINEAATFRSFFTALKRDCSEYIDLIKGKKRMLYRGLKTHDSPLLKLASRENRKPKDSPLPYQDAMDRWLQSRGFEARRSNSYFATAEPHDAKKYGAVYMVFPCNGFQYTWFQDGFDLWVARGQFYRSLREIAKTSQEEINQFKDLDDALNKGLWTVEQQDAAMNIFMSEMGPINCNLTSALQSDHEIMLTGQYYAVKLDSKYAGTIISFLQGLNDENV